MTEQTGNRIRVSLAFTKAVDSEVLSRGQSAVIALTGNPAYSNPPVDLAVLKADLGNLSTAITDAFDGGKKAIAEKKRLRGEVVKKLRALAHYVESACNDDLTTFLSSGFDPLSITRVPPQPLPPALIKKIDQGNTGQLLISIAKVRRAFSYELRYAALGAGAATGPWTSIAAPTVLQPTMCNGLTPGTTYAFQVRALGRLGFTDWSDSVTKMCT